MSYVFFLPDKRPFINSVKRDATFWTKFCPLPSEEHIFLTFAVYFGPRHIPFSPGIYHLPPPLVMGEGIYERLYP